MDLSRLVSTCFSRFSAWAKISSFFSSLEIIKDIQKCIKRILSENTPANGVNLKNYPLALDGHVSTEFHESFVFVVFGVQLLGKLSEALDDFGGLVHFVCPLVCLGLLGAAVEIAAAAPPPASSSVSTS